MYLTGRDPGRVAESLHRLSNTKADVRAEVLDVAKGDAVERFADTLAERHGGVDIGVPIITPACSRTTIRAR